MEENVTQINGVIMINVNVSVKDIIYVKKIIIVILPHAVAKMENIQQYSVVTCDEIIDAEAKLNDKETKTIPKNIICETKSFYTLFAFLLITIALLVAVSIYYYLFKHKAKEKHLLPFYVTKK